MAAYYTKEEIRQARQADIVAYLESVNEAARLQGKPEPYRLKSEGKEIRVEGHGGLLVAQNYWSVQSQKTVEGGKVKVLGGNTLDFLIKYEGKSFAEAMAILTGKRFQERSAKAVATRSEIKEYQPKEDKSDFQLPEKNGNARRAIAYLTKTRFIDPKIVIDQVKKGNIYEDKEHHNVVFVGRSPDGEPRWANKRSTLSNSNFKGDAKSSDPRYPFVIRNDLNRDDGYLIATESPIEAMSYATILKMQGEEVIRNDIMGIGGAHAVGIVQYLKDHPKTKGVVLALNNDRQGHESTKLIEQQLRELGYLDSPNFTLKVVMPKGGYKDWNDFLKDLVQKREQEKKLEEERGIAGGLTIQLPGRTPQVFKVSRNKIVRNGAECIVLYGEKDMALLNTKTLTFGLAEGAKDIKHTYFVKKVEIDPDIKKQIFELANRPIVQKRAYVSIKDLLKKDPKELTVEEAVKVYQYQKRLREQAKAQQAKEISQDRAIERERVRSSR